MQVKQQPSAALSLVLMPWLTGRRPEARGLSCNECSSLPGLGESHMQVRKVPKLHSKALSPVYHIHNMTHLTCKIQHAPLYIRALPKVTDSCEKSPNLSVCLRPQTPHAFGDSDAEAARPPGWVCVAVQW